MKNKFTLILIVLLTQFTLYSISHSQDSKKWSYQFEVYALAANIEGTATVGRASGAPIDVGFDKILENLELAGMLHFEAFHESAWGVIVDYAFMDLAGTKKNPRDGIAKVGVRQGMLEALAAYRIDRGDTRIDFFAGIRWWDNDLELTLDPAIHEGSASLRVKEDWVDVIVGGRIIAPLSQKWFFIGHADIGGLELSSDLTISASAGVRYQMTKSAILDLRYKALWVDYENDNTGSKGGFAYDTVTHGPLIGVIFEF